MKRAVWLVAGLLIVLVTAAVHARIAARTPPTGQELELFVPKPEYAKMLALGFDSVLADYYWIRSVLLVGGATSNPAQHSVALGRMIDVVTTLDPWVGHPYRFAAVWLDQSEEDVLQANRLLRRGIEHHPDDWRQYFYLGFNLFYYLQEYQEAADVLQEAATKPRSPSYLPRLVARLRSEDADLDAVAIFLNQMVRDAPDERSRAQYQGALDEIEVEHRARFLDRARAAFVDLSGYDIEEVDDLLYGPHAVLDRLPDPEPSSLPAGLRQGSVWELDDDGQIVSSYYRRRYGVHFHDRHKRRLEQWAAQRDHADATDSEEGGDGS